MIYQLIFLCVFAQVFTARGDLWPSGQKIQRYIHQMDNKEEIKSIVQEALKMFEKKLSAVSGGTPLDVDMDDIWIGKAETKVVKGEKMYQIKAKLWEGSNRRRSTYNDCLIHLNPNDILQQYEVDCYIFMQDYGCTNYFDTRNPQKYMNCNHEEVKVNRPYKI